MAGGKRIEFGGQPAQASGAAPELVNHPGHSFTEFLTPATQLGNGTYAPADAATADGVGKARVLVRVIDAGNYEVIASAGWVDWPAHGLLLADGGTPAINAELFLADGGGFATEAGTHRQSVGSVDGPNRIIWDPDGIFSSSTSQTGVTGLQETGLIFLARWDTENAWTAPIGWSHAQWDVRYDPFGVAVPGQNYLQLEDFAAGLGIAIGDDVFPGVRTTLTWLDNLPRGSATFGLDQFTEIAVRGGLGGDNSFRKTRSTAESFSMTTSVPPRDGTQFFENTTIGFYLNNTSGVDFVNPAGDSNYRRHTAGTSIAVYADRVYTP